MLIKAQFLAFHLDDGEEMITIIWAVKVDKYRRYQTRFGTFVTVQGMQQWNKGKLLLPIFHCYLMSLIERGCIGLGVLSFYATIITLHSTPLSHPVTQSFELA